MALVAGNEDIVLLLKDYCKICATKKLRILEIFNVTPDEAHGLKKAGTRIKRVSCDCERDVIDNK